MNCRGAMIELKAGKKQPGCSEKDGIYSRWEDSAGAGIWTSLGVQPAIVGGGESDCGGAVD